MTVRVGMEVFSQGYYVWQGGKDAEIRPEFFGGRKDIHADSEWINFWQPLDISRGFAIIIELLPCGQQYISGCSADW